MFFFIGIANAAYETTSCKAEISKKDYNLGEGMRSSGIQNRLISIGVNFSQRADKAGIVEYKNFISTGVTKLEELKKGIDFSQTQTSMVNIVSDFLKCQLQFALSDPGIIIGETLGGIQVENSSSSTNTSSSSTSGGNTNSSSNNSNSPATQLCKLEYGNSPSVTYRSDSQSNCLSQCNAAGNSTSVKWKCTYGDKTLKSYDAQNSPVSPNPGENGSPAPANPSTGGNIKVKKCSLEKDNVYGWINIDVTSQTQCLSRCEAYKERGGMTCIYKEDNTNFVLKTFPETLTDTQYIKTNLNCQYEKDIVGNWFYDNGRCPDDIGYDYWDTQYNKLLEQGVGASSAQVRTYTLFMEEMNRECREKSGTTNKTKCYSILFCAPGYEYVTNTNMCIGK